MNLWKWLYPGLGMKRWFSLIFLGICLILAGVMLFFNSHIIFLFVKIKQFLEMASPLIAVLFIIAGVFIIYYSIKAIIINVGRERDSNQELVDILYQQKKLEKGPRIVALGGGTGLSNLLRGLKKETSNITGIVTVADDGGSSGKLRDELGILPPGDIRNCLVALADTEPLMEELFQYRFSDEGHLVGHSFGNLFIASMTQVLGDFEEAVKESSKVLAIKGQVVPATNEDVRLGAIYRDQSQQLGESLIPREGKKIEQVFLDPASCAPTADAVDAINQADIIVVGPGSLYTSILPNLLVKDIARAIERSKAVKIYVCNVMTQPGETTGYTASDHLQAIKNHVGVNLFDYIILNNEPGSQELARRYEQEGAFPVRVDRQELKKENVELIEDNLLTDQGYIRHDPDRLAGVIFSISGYEYSNQS